MKRLSAASSLVFAFAALGLPFSIPSASGADWPGWMGPNRDGKSAETGLLKQWPAGGPTLLWKATDIGKGYSSVAVVKDTVYISGDVGTNLTISAFDSKGQRKWKAVQGPVVKVDRPGLRSSPMCDDGKLYMIGVGGLITCHDIANGNPLWKREMSEFGGAMPHWGYAESPLVLDNMLIVTPGGKNSIVALDKTTGKNVWACDYEAAAHYCSAIPIKEKDTTVIVQGTGDGLLIVDAKSGKRLWSLPFSAKNTANCPTPAYADGLIFWANGYGKGGVCVKAERKDDRWNFNQAWTTADMVCHHGGYIIEKGYIYGNHNSGWSCIELKSGQTKWKDQAGVGKGSICFADGMLYLFSEGGQVGLAPASPEGLKMTGEFKVAGSGPSWAHPVVADGRLYIRYDTNLYCYDVKAK